MEKRPKNSLSYLCPAEGKRKHPVKQMTPSPGRHLSSNNSSLWIEDLCFQTTHQCTYNHTHKHFLPHILVTSLETWLSSVCYYYWEWAAILGAVNLTEVQNTPSHPKLAITLSYSRLYVIIAWQHTKIKEVALVHILIRLHSSTGFSLQKEGIVFGTHISHIYIILNIRGWLSYYISDKL